jgi:hypothetical protein
MSEPIKKLEKISAVIATVALVIVLACASILFFFAHPQADDFNVAGKASTFGIWDGVKDEYFNWTGRWAQSFILFSVSSLFDLVKVYGLLLALTSVIFAFSLFVFLKKSFGGEISTRSAMMTAAAVFGLHWVNAISPGQSFYWWAGAVSYNLNLACILLLFSGLLSLRNQNRLVMVSQTCLLCIFAFFVAGMHELFSLVLCLILGVCLAVMIKIRHPNWIIWSMVFLVAVLGFLVVFAAPGNEVRKLSTGQVVKYGDFTLALSLTLEQGIHFARSWVLDLGVLSATLFLVLNQQFRAITLPWFLRQHPTWKWGIPLTWIAILVTAIFGSSWSLGKWMPPRVSDAIYILFLIGWMATVFVFTRESLDKVLESKTVLNSIRAFSLGIFSLSLLNTGVASQAALELIGGQVAKYDRNMQQRYKQIQSDIDNGKIDVRVPKVGNRPKIYFHGFNWAGITEDPGYWQNRFAARFFKVNSLAVESSNGQSSNPTRK